MLKTIDFYNKKIYNNNYLNYGFMFGLDNNKGTLDPSKIWANLSKKADPLSPRDLIKSSALLTSLSGNFWKFGDLVLPQGKIKSVFERFAQTNHNQTFQNTILETFQDRYLAVSQNGFPLRHLSRLPKLSYLKQAVAEKSQLDLLPKTREEISTSMGQCKGMALLFASLYFEMIKTIEDLNSFEEELIKITSAFTEGNTKKGIVLSSLINDVNHTMSEKDPVQTVSQFEEEAWNSGIIRFLVDHKIIPVAHKVLGLTSEVHHIFSLANQDKTTELLTELEPGCYLTFSIDHSMVLIKKENQFYLFDPNAGLTRFSSFQEFKYLTARATGPISEKDPDASSLSLLKITKS